MLSGIMYVRERPNGINTAHGRSAQKERKIALPRGRQKKN